MSQFQQNAAQKAVSGRLSAFDRKERTADCFSRHLCYILNVLAPFAALVGYDDVVAETARLTESRPELDEQEQRVINERLAYLANHIKEQPVVRIQHFVPDERKSGGAIVEVSGQVKRISDADATITLADGCKI